MASDFMTDEVRTAVNKFDPIEVGWKGTVYVVKSDDVFGLLQSIENTMSPDQKVSAIDLLARPHRAHITKLAEAYTSALVYAGCRDVTRDEVLLSLNREVMKGGVEGFAALKILADGLLNMFFPPEERDALGNSQGGDGSPPKKKRKTRSRKA